MGKAEERYTIPEISAASGINRSTLESRRKLRGIPDCKEGYTLSEAKAITSGFKKKIRSEKVQELKEKLKTEDA